MKTLLYIVFAIFFLASPAMVVYGQKGAKSKKLLADKRKNKDQKPPQKNEYRFKQYEKTSKKEKDAFGRKSKFNTYGKKADKKVAKKKRKNATAAFSSKNKKKKRKSSIRASKGKIQEDDPFRPRQKNRGLAGQKKKRDRDAFRFSNRKQEKKKAKNRRDKNKTPKLGLQNKQPDKVKRNKKKID